MGASLTPVVSFTAQHRYSMPQWSRPHEEDATLYADPTGPA